MFNFWMTLLSDHTIQVVFVGSLVLGITAGSLGTFAVLRQQSLLGDAIAHATLPGVCAAFLLTQSKSPLVLLIGAGMAGWVGTLLIKVVVEHTRLKRDAALGIVLSVFFGFGLVLITIVQRLPTAAKAGLDKFLFGNAATLLVDDVRLMAVLGLITLLLVFLFWKEFKILTFDQSYAQSIGIRVHTMDILLTTLIVIAIVIGLQTVGVVLMSAMLVAPAAAARQWTDNLGKMMALSAVFGALAGICGSLTSSLLPRIPTGPMIVIYLSGFVFSSLLFAPRRGLFGDWIRNDRNRKQIQTTSMLKNMMLFSEMPTNPFHPHDIAALQAIGRGGVRKTMLDLQKKGWVKQVEEKWALTPKGLDEARRLTKMYEDQFDVNT